MENTKNKRIVRMKMVVTDWLQAQTHNERDGIWQSLTTQNQ